MMAGMARRSFLGWSGVLAALVFVGCLLAPLTALGITAGKVTLNQDTGGKPARFTIVAVTDVDTSTTSIRVTFPKGFDLSTISTMSVDILRGVDVTHVSASPKIEGTSIRFAMDPPLPAKVQLRVLIYDLTTPFDGGVYDLGFEYVAGGRTRSASGLQFSYLSPPLSERISKWLDRQPFVTAWNSVKFFGLFLRPQLIVEAVFLAFLGWLWSLALVGTAFPIAIVGGLIMAFLKMSKIGPVRWVASIYVNVIRGTPLFLQIYIAFVGLPIAGLHVHWFVLGFIVLALNSAAYLTEIFRAGIQSINRGQFEAASSLGMTYAQAMRYVIIPQTVKRVLPTMTSEFILLYKDTALLFPVGVFELMMYSNQLVARSGNLTPFVVAAGFYLIITTPLINWVGSLERRLAVAEGGQVSDHNPRKHNRWRWWPASAGPEHELQASVAEHESR